MGCGVWGLGFGGWGLGFGVWGLGCGVWGWGLGYGVWGLGFGVWGQGLEGRVLRFGTEDSGCRVEILGARCALQDVNLNSKPSILNLEPQTPNPRASTPKPRPQRAPLASTRRRPAQAPAFDRGLNQMQHGLLLYCIAIGPVALLQWGLLPYCNGACCPIAIG